LHDITNIERIDINTRSHCLVLETSLHKRYLLSFGNDDQLYNWQDAIYSRSRLAGISSPVNFVHNMHIGIDGVSGELTVSQKRNLFLGAGGRGLLAVYAFFLMLFFRLQGVPDQWKPMLRPNL